MTKELQRLIDELRDQLQASYESSVSVTEAEKLAAKFLHAQFVLSSELQDMDLNSRMKKSGLKAIKAAVYLEMVQKSDKKPSDVLLEHTINLDEIVLKGHDDFDKTESERDSLQNYYNIFREAHIFYRGIAKGSFSG